MSFNKTAIDWPWKPLYTWNPVTGCKRGCSYCYARKIHERFNKTPFSEIVYHQGRMVEPPKSVKHVFAGSMSDIEYWKPEQVEAVIDYCDRNRQVQFYFLSKNPLSYYGYHTFPWPDNVVLGLTVTLATTEQLTMEKIYEMGNYKRRFLSIEPLLGNAYPSFKLRKFEKVIVGAMTGPGAIGPQPEWIGSIKALKLENVYWKNNIGGDGNGKLR